jgi:gamma-glutamyltranspeptidase/glutathione hydrolase
MYRNRRRCVTGLPVCADGIDNFCLFYDAKTKKVGGINGSGRAPKALNLEFLRKQGITGDSVRRTADKMISADVKIPLDNLNSVTVPCAASGWLKTVETYGSGKLSMAEILAPAIRIAKEGVPQHEVNARSVCVPQVNNWETGAHW